MSVVTAESSISTSRLHLANGLVGLPDATEFTISGGADGVFELESVDDPALGFVVVAPAPFFPDYAPVLDDATVAGLGLEGNDDALVLLVITLGDADTPPNANLMAPIVVNRRTREAAQLVLADQGFPLRAAFLD